MANMVTGRNVKVYNCLGVIAMNTTEKAIELVESLSAEKLEIAVGVLELLVKTDNARELIDLIRFEISCEAEAVTPEEKNGIIL